MAIVAYLLLAGLLALPLLLAVFYLARVLAAALTRGVARLNSATPWIKIVLMALGIAWLLWMIRGGGCDSGDDDFDA